MAGDGALRALHFVEGGDVFLQLVGNGERSGVERIFLRVQRPHRIDVKGQQTFVAHLTDFGVPGHPLNRQNVVWIFVPFVFPTQAVAGMPPFEKKK